MRYTAKVRRDGSGYTADCVEVEATGHGATRDAAVESLRSALEESVGRVEAVAPPSNSDLTIEIAVAQETP